MRLTTRRTPPFEAGTYVEVKARLLPPSRAAQPGGYDFARDAWFARIGAVGSVLGRMEEAEAPEPPGFWLAADMAVDRARNALARRVDTIVGGDPGAIAAAMVTGKRDLLSEDARSLIREAGIYHVITISGVQMTLVAGIFFVGLRRLLALSRTLALGYPIKKWAAGAAIVAAVAYDVMTGSRIGTERALFMTLIMLTAVILDRHALTMRNLALAAMAVLVWQPEALLGASFQLSFAAVAALVSVYEARSAAHAREAQRQVTVPAHAGGRRGWFGRRRARRPWAAGCTRRHLLRDQRHRLVHGLRLPRDEPLRDDRQSVDADDHRGLRRARRAHRHAALPRSASTPLSGIGSGSESPSSWPRHASLARCRDRACTCRPSHPGPSPFSRWAVLSAVIWRTWPLKLAAVPLALLGLLGALSGPTFDVAVAAGGEAAAVRGEDGRLVVIGRRPVCSMPNNGCAPTPTRVLPRRPSARNAATRSAASPSSRTAAPCLWCSIPPLSRRIACGLP